MKPIQKICFSSVLLFLSIHVSAYEIETHAQLSKAAVEASRVTLDPSLLKNLGIDPTQKFTDSEGDKLLIPDIVQAGSRFEDNNTRPANHFYDPLTGQGISGFKPSPDWALEDKADLGDSQKFSYKDARQYFRDALTSPAKTDRDKNFGLTFQTLGQVIHHLQDMAQPQHVRGDLHCDAIVPCLVPGILFGKYAPSIYEKYTDLPQVRGNPNFFLSVYAPLDTGLIANTFSSPRKFWRTSPEGQADISAGIGMAEFTNRNFVSAGTNFDKELGMTGYYPSPQFDPSTATQADIQTLCAQEAAEGRPCPNASLAGKITFYGNTVEDKLSGETRFNPRASSESIFDAELTKANFKPAFTLNRFNFNAAHQFLIPRAVAYSAGLINYFFRGKIDFVPDAVNAGKFTIKNLGAEVMTGTFTLYYDAVDGNRYPVAGDAPAETWTNLTIAANQQLDNLSFTPPTNPAPKTPDEYMLVFKGDMGEEKAVNGAVGAVVAKLIQPGGATDYVMMAMPNPVPYRGVNVGVVAGSPDPGTEPPLTTYASLSEVGGDYQYGQLLSLEWCGGVVGGTARENWVGGDRTVYADGVQIDHGTNVAWSYASGGQQSGGGLIYKNFPSVITSLDAVPGYYTSDGESSSYNSCSGGAANTVTSTWHPAPTKPNPAHAVWQAAKDAYDANPNKIYVMASDGTVLASEAQNTSGGHTYYVPDTTWKGGDYADMYVDTVSGSPDHRLTFTAPEDCVYPAPATPLAAFNARRKNWFKKNSDEFIVALKTGFAANAPGVTHAELQNGRLLSAWEYQIKRDVAVQYGAYPSAAQSGGYWVTEMPAWWNTNPDEDGPWVPYYVGGSVIQVGQKTKRAIQYSETAFSDTVQNDSSANLTQAGVMVTQRAVTLGYTIGTETRSTTITGTLAQTVTRHNDAQGNQLGLSQNDIYSNWYNRESYSLPAGIPVNATTWSYTKDRGIGGIGIVLNGTVQSGYDADSLSPNGVPGNPLGYALYNPPYPKASSTITADTPDFIKTWHKDAQIEYLADGIGASGTLNDSALFGVTEIHITPVGLIADGAGHAAAGESVGIFSSGEDGTQVEIYGTATYKFDWQTGALTFTKWDPLHDANGNEVASKSVQLPAGAVWSDTGINTIITYKGLHWPDVITVLQARDQDMSGGTFGYTDPSLYALIQAVKAR